MHWAGSWRWPAGGTAEAHGGYRQTDTEEFKRHQNRPERVQTAQIIVLPAIWTVLSWFGQPVLVSVGQWRRLANFSWKSTDFRLFRINIGNFVQISMQRQPCAIPAKRPIWRQIPTKLLRNWSNDTRTGWPNQLRTDQIVGILESSPVLRLNQIRKTQAITLRTLLCSWIVEQFDHSTRWWLFRLTESQDTYLTQQSQCVGVLRSWLLYRCCTIS